MLVCTSFGERIKFQYCTELFSVRPCVGIVAVSV